LGTGEAMKTLLLNLPLRPESPLIQFPIGLAFIASAIKRAGLDLDILNIDGLRLSEPEVETFLRRHAYDVICLGTMVTGYSKVKAITKLIRQVQPKATIVVGNTVATSIPGILLTRTETDIAVMGEGDETIVDLLGALANGRPWDEVPGICYLDGQRLVTTPARPAIKDISSIPMIDYSLWEMEIYLANSPRWVHEPCPIPRHECGACRSTPPGAAWGIAPSAITTSRERPTGIAPIRSFSTRSPGCRPTTA
jgi:hypothetical protein